MAKTVMVQIRNMPQPIHRILKSRAALAGMSLSDYILRELRGVAETPTIEELVARMEKHEPVTAGFDSAAILREDRELH